MEILFDSGATLFATLSEIDYPHQSIRMMCCHLWAALGESVNNFNSNISYYMISVRLIMKLFCHAKHGLVFYAISDIYVE